ncbi:uncharacterized protein LOC115228188 [Argonauta hians]
MPIQRSQSFLIVLLVIIFSASVPCILSDQRYSQAELDEYIENFTNTLMSEKNLVAGAVSVVKNDELVYSQTFGRRNLNSNISVDNQTLFGISSLSKAFAAATLVKVIEETNGLNLTTPISQFVEIEFPTEERTKYANVEDLLAHRMGLPRNNFLRLNKDFKRHTIPRFIKHFQELRDFRTSFIYNNIMYGLATYITEILTLKRWEDLVFEEILRPLQMSDTTFGTDVDDDYENIARSYVQREGKKLVQVSPLFKRKWADIGGSGAILSTANDMAKWMKFLLNGNTSLVCNLFRVRNYAPQTKVIFRRPEMPITYTDESYALGWRRGYYRGYPLIMHTGTSWGDFSILTLFPEEKLGIFAVFTGSDSQHVSRHLLMEYIADLYLGYQPWMNASSIADFKPPKQRSNCPKVPFKRSRLDSPTITKYNNVPSNMSEYEGTYNNYLWGNLTVHYNTRSDKLFLTYGFMTLQLTSKSSMPNSFGGRGIKEMDFFRLTSINFNRKRTSGIHSVTIPSFERSVPPTFIKIG